MGRMETSDSPATRERESEGGGEGREKGRKEVHNNIGRYFFERFQHFTIDSVNKIKSLKKIYATSAFPHL